MWGFGYFLLRVWGLGYGGFGSRVQGFVLKLMMKIMVILTIAAGVGVAVVAVIFIRDIRLNEYQLDTRHDLRGAA